MKVTFWLRDTDKKYWRELRTIFKPSEILSRGIELVYLEQVEGVLHYDEKGRMQSVQTPD